MPEQAIILSLSENMKYMRKVLDLLENHEIRALIDNRNETIGRRKLEMLKCKNPVYADCRRGRRENGTISVVTDKKERKYHRYNRRICCYCKKRNQKTLKVFTV
jgi:threonyl-tRNA synthetase